METTMIIIAILLCGVSNLIIVAMLGFVAFRILTTTNDTPSNRDTQASTPSKTGEVDEQVRRRMMEEQEALSELFNYNANVAYGIKTEDYK